MKRRRDLSLVSTGWAQLSLEPSGHLINMLVFSPLSPRKLSQLGSSDWALGRRALSPFSFSFSGEHRTPAGAVVAPAVIYSNQTTATAANK